MTPHRHTVLIIDDDADILDALRITLTLADVNADAVSSGREALALVRGGHRPCAMFLDIRMPDLDGWQVWQELRAGDPDVAAIPVILVSAETPDPARAAANGIAGWLQKPVGVQKLFDALTQVCPRAAP
jgi:CheY-like chemotaxis protein